MNSWQNLKPMQKFKSTNQFPYKEAELLKGLSPEKAHADLLAEEPVQNLWEIETKWT